MFKEWLAKKAVELVVGDLIKKGKDSAYYSDVSKVFKSNKDLYRKNVSKKGRVSYEKVPSDPEVERKGSQGWDDSSLQLGPSKLETAVLDVAVPALGDATKVVGDSSGIINTAFAKALLQAADYDRSDPYARFSREKMMAPGLQALAAGKIARGEVINNAADVINNRLQTVANNIKVNNQNARDRMFEVNEDPSASYWRAADTVPKTKAKQLAKEEVKGQKRSR